MFQLLLLDKPFRDRVITNVSSTSTRLFWKNYDGLRQQDQLDRSESTLDRIDSLISNSIIRNVVGQSHISINFRDIMDTGKILLVSLSAQYESLTSLLGSIIIGQLLTASLSRAGTSKRRQFNLYADEYQRFATPDFATLLTEARKFGVATTIAHQVRSQLDEKNAATALQAGSLVCFRLTSEDADELSAEFLLTPKEAVKGAPTTPANILDYIDRHGNDIVKEYIFAYLRKLRSAKGGNAIGQFSHHNFGGGDVGFYQYMPDEALEAQEKLFFYCIDKEIVYLDLFYRAVNKMLPLLKIESFTPLVRLLIQGDVTTDVIEQMEKDIPEDEKQRYHKFTQMLYKVCGVLTKEKIAATNTEWTEATSQQTYADRKNQIANELVHLKRGHAMVKLPSGEYLMETIPNTSSHADSSKKQHIIDITRKTYCRSRHEIEEEIRARQERDEPPTSKRRGMV